MEKPEGRALAGEVGWWGGKDRGGEGAGQHSRQWVRVAVSLADPLCLGMWFSILGSLMEAVAFIIPLPNIRADKMWGGRRDPLRPCHTAPLRQWFLTSGIHLPARPRDTGFGEKLPR